MLRCALYATEINCTKEYKKYMATGNLQNHKNGPREQGMNINSWSQLASFGDSVTTHQSNLLQTQGTTFLPEAEL